MILNGGEPIPITKPPCHDDPDPDSEDGQEHEFVCPKKKPGYSDLNEQAAEVFWHWRLCDSLDEHPPEREAKRFRKILDGLRDTIEQAREESRIRELTESYERARRGR